MTGKELFREIGMIDEKYIVEAESTKRTIIHNVVFRRSLATAACLVVCVGLYFGTRMVSHQSADMSAGNAGGTSYQNTEKNMADAAYDAEIQMASQEAMLQPEEAVEDNAKTDGAPRENETIETETQEGAGALATDTGQETDSLTQSQECMEVGAGSKELEDLQKHLAEYPSTFDELCQTEAFVVMQGQIQSGKSQLTDFMKAVEASEETCVDIVQFTTEGVPIITCLEYTTTAFRVTVDSGRDGFAADTNGLPQESYLYLHVIQQDGYEKVVLSDEKNLTAENLQSEEYRSYIVVEYQEVN